MAKVHCCQSPIFHSNLVEWVQKSLTTPLVLFTWTALAVIHINLTLRHAAVSCSRCEGFFVLVGWGGGIFYLVLVWQAICAVDGHQLEVCITELVLNKTRQDETGGQFPNWLDRDKTTSLWSRGLGKSKNNPGNKLIFSLGSYHDLPNAIKGKGFPSSQGIILRP